MASPNDPRGRGPFDPLTIDDVFVRSTPGELYAAARLVGDRILSMVRDAERAEDETRRELGRGKQDTERQMARSEHDVGRLSGIVKDDTVEDTVRALGHAQDPNGLEQQLPPVPEFPGDPPEFVDPHQFNRWPGSLPPRPPDPDGRHPRDPDQPPGPYQPPRPPGDDKRQPKRRDVLSEE